MQILQARRILPHFLIAPQIFSNAPNKNSNIFKRDWSKFNHEFILDYFAKDWPNIMKLQDNNIDPSFSNFLGSMSKIFDKHAPLEKLIKDILKFKTKPCTAKIYSY